MRIEDRGEGSGGGGGGSGEQTWLSASPITRDGANFVVRRVTVHTWLKLRVNTVKSRVYAAPGF